MTCKDCVHYEVCRHFVDLINPLLADHNRIDINENTDICKEHFQDHSRFVELPYALHLCDEVHFVLRGLDEIDLKEYSFTVGNSAVSDTVQYVTEIGKYGFWVGESPREFAPDYDDFYHWYELGETVFLTRKAAEQALKEREGNA